MPAAYTPQEIYKCQAEGARTVKLFPAQMWTIKTLKAVRGVGDFCKVNFCPSGGINHDNAPLWLEAGAAAVGMGSCLAGSDIKIPPPTNAEEQAKFDAACEHWASVGRPGAIALVKTLGIGAPL